MPEPRIDTIRAMHERRYALSCYCPKCDRWIVPDLARLIEEGRGDYNPIGRWPDCSVCGERRQWRLQPPVYRAA